MKKSTGVILLTAIWLAACSSNISSTIDVPTPSATTPSSVGVPIPSATIPSSVGVPIPSATIPSLLPHSMKGYELYSWLLGDQWQFTLITGTNRIKSLEEITEGENVVSSDGWVRIRVQGVETINRILGSLSNHEEIFWIIDPRLEQAEIPANKVELPPQEIVDAIKESCWQLKLELTVVGSDMQE